VERTQNEERRVERAQKEEGFEDLTNATDEEKRACP
jgi:hypothetical protein